MKRFLLTLLPLALALSIGAQAAEEAGDSGTLFPQTRVYDGEFGDVSADSWFYRYAVFGFEYGLFTGRDTGFAPDADITVAELLTLSARLRAAYEGETIPESAPGSPWYNTYANYLLEKGALDSTLLSHIAERATRAQLAAVFAASLPEECFDNRNSDLVTSAYASGKYITDISEYTPYQPEILWLYRQGLLTGMDETGTFQPENTTTRAQTAAVVMRIVDPSLRETLNWAVEVQKPATGRTLGSLIAAPDTIINRAPQLSDAAAIDALCREMLSKEENTILLDYGVPLGAEEVSSMARTFNAVVKSYCEQMYNAVFCESYRSGSVVLTFYATACIDNAQLERNRGDTLAKAAEQLVRLRSEAMAKALEVHDMLWKEGHLTEDMTQYEIARVYYLWLCDNCEYDYHAVDNDSSLSHIGYSALLRNKAVCDGYTGAYNLFLKLEGIDCTSIANDTHIWTIANLDGTEYHIDPTWGDQTGRVDISCFGMTAQQAYQLHPW